MENDQYQDYNPLWPPSTTSVCITRRSDNSARNKSAEPHGRLTVVPDATESCSSYCTSALSLQLSSTSISTSSVSLSGQPPIDAEAPCSNDVKFNGADWLCDTEDINKTWQGTLSQEDDGLLDAANSANFETTKVCYGYYTTTVRAL